MADDIVTVLLKLTGADAASPAIDKVGKSVDKLDDNAKRANKTLRDTGQASKETKASLTQLDQAIGGAVTAFAGLAVVQFASQMRAHGEEVRKTANTYRELAGGAEQASATLEQLRARTRGMVTDTELMAGAAQLLKTGLASSNDEAVKLLGLATDLGASTSELFSVLANQSYEVLDSFGVASGAVRELKNELVEAGMSSEEAFKEAFLVEAQKTIERLGDSIEQNLSPSQQLEVRWQNFWDQVSVGAATTLNDAITAAEQLLVIVGASTNPTMPVMTNGRWQYDPNTGQLMKLYGAGVSPEQQQIYQNIVDRAQGKLTADDLPDIQLPDWLNQEDITESITGAVSAWGNLLDQMEEDAKQREKEQAEALKANQRAIEENTRALERQSDQITGSVESLLGWKPPEQRELEGSQQSIRDALRRAGLSQEELDQVMLNAQQALPYYLQQGLTPGQAALRAYGVNDPTPGAGYDAQFVGQAPIPTMQEEGKDTFWDFLSGLVGGASDVTAELPSEEDQAKVLKFLGNIGDLAEAYSKLMPESPMTFGGYDYGSAGDSQPFNYASGATLPPPSQNMMRGPFNLPPSWQPANNFNYASGATLPPPSQNMMRGPFNLPPSWQPPQIQPEQIVSGPANFGGMDYSQLPAYTAPAAADVTVIAEQSALAADPAHLGAWPGIVQETNTEVGGLKTAIEGITSKSHAITFDVDLNQKSRDKLTQWVFEVLRSAGVNIGGGGGASGSRPY